MLKRLKLNRLIVSFLATAGMLGGFLWAADGPMTEPTAVPSLSKGDASATPESGGKIVDFTAERGYPIPYGDTTATVLVGNFAAHHNGAVITADSAIRFSDKHLEFFGNVLINKNNTYIYGERAEYNGEINEARVYSRLVKTVDGEATLYTYDFVFNTLDNIGKFTRGGILQNRENQVESVRGYFYADRHELIAVDRVEMRNDTYSLKGDSVIYNTETDRAYFFDRTNIWDRDGDYLYADRGRYEKLPDLYALTRNGYVLTPKEELWSDSLNYFRTEEHVRLWKDIQIDDTEHKVLAFGDYGEYWKEPGNALLTRLPSVISYDTSRGDSLYMRADTMFLYTLSIRDEQADSLSPDSVKMPMEKPHADSLEGVETSPQTEVAEPAVSTSKSELQEDRIDSVAVQESDTSFVGGDSLLVNSGKSVVSVPDSLGLSLVEEIATADSLASVADTLTPKERKAFERAETKRLKALEKAEADSVKRVLRIQADSVKAVERAQAAAARKEKLDRIAEARQARATAKLEAQEQKAAARRAKQLSRLRARERARYEKAVMKGKLPASALDSLDALYASDTIPQDSLSAQSSRDSLITDSLRQDSLLPEKNQGQRDSLVAERKDSTYRLIKGYRSVRIFRNDFQSVCDSLVALSSDSTIMLYVDPVMWNQDSQISSDVIKIYTRNSQLDKAEFIDRPIMISQLDTVAYNQISGKLITAFFRDNKIFRNDVDGNVQTLYYMQEEDSPDPMALMFIQSGSATYYIDNNTITNIVYRNQPDCIIYPMDKIPVTQKLYLEDFKWEGERRPHLRDVFERQIRPSEREEKSKLKQPDFPLTRRINTYKASMIESGVWVDRDDKLSPETMEWLQWLGVK